MLYYDDNMPVWTCQAFPRCFLEAFDMNLSDRLNALKEIRNLLQKDIAKAVGLSLRAYQRYEYGERVPDANVLITLADFFDVSLDYLVGRSDDPKRR